MTDRSSSLEFYPPECFDSIFKACDDGPLEAYFSTL
jgi:hypothetical protein